MSKNYKPLKSNNLPYKVKGYKSSVSYSVNKDGVLTRNIRFTQKPKRNISIPISNTFGLSVFHYVFIILFIISFYYALIGRDFNLSFSGLLSILEEAPSIPTDWITDFANLTITGNWGVFEFLKTFLNTIMGIISFALYFVTGASQLVVYFGYFLGEIFGY